MRTRSLATLAISSTIALCLIGQGPAQSQQGAFPTAVFSAAKIPTYPGATFFDSYIDTTTHVRLNKAEFTTPDAIAKVTAWYRGHLDTSFKLGSVQAGLSSSTAFTAGVAGKAGERDVVLHAISFPGRGRVTDIIMMTAAK